MQNTVHSKDLPPRAPAVVVSVHDVSPLTMRQTEGILRDLAVAGIVRTSLLVIPDHHRAAPIAEAPEFGRWLRERCAEGHEAVLHGYFHLRAARAGEGLRDRLITRSYTAGEGEFFDLEGGEAVRRLRLGREAMSACGVDPCGFIAPAWLLGAEAELAVRREGFSYTTRIGTVSDYRTGAVHRSRSLVWSVRAGWRRVCSLLWNGALAQATKGSPLVRIGIHPPDWEHAAIRRQVLRVAGLASRRRVETYAGWLGIA